METRSFISEKAIFCSLLERIQMLVKLGNFLEYCYLMFERRLGPILKTSKCKNVERKNVVKLCFVKQHLRQTEQSMYAIILVRSSGGKMSVEGGDVKV